MAVSSAPVVVLAGGTGGAKLARGMLDVAGPDALVVVANTGDDIEIYGAHVSPDPDLVSFWLADRIDERGWGLREDSFAVMDALRELGEEVWFNLGDRDLAWCLERRRRIDAGARPTEVLAQLGARIGVRSRVLPMCDEPVRTWVRAHGRRWSLQEFLIRAGGAGPIDEVGYEGLRSARPTPEVHEALARARAVIVGPSNPVISIGPILAVPGMRAAIAAARADGTPVVAVSPIVEGAVLKGPTEEFLAALGQPATAAGVAALYEGVIDGIVADEPVDGVPVLRTDTLMGDAAGRRRVAADTLRFAQALGAR
jgi:LPPG:FO 2-phospho-L-lactate transferase